MSTSHLLKVSCAHVDMAITHKLHAVPHIRATEFIEHSVENLDVTISRTCYHLSRDTFCCRYRLVSVAKGVTGSPIVRYNHC